MGSCTIAAGIVPLEPGRGCQRRHEGDGRRCLPDHPVAAGSTKRAGACRGGQRANCRMPGAPRRAIARREDSTWIRRVFESYAYVTDLIDDKNTSIRHGAAVLRLRELEKTEASGRDPKTRDVRGHGIPPDAAAENESAADLGTPDLVRKRQRPPRVTAAASPAAYRGAERVDVAHPMCCVRAMPVRPAATGPSTTRPRACSSADHRVAAAGGDGVSIAETPLPPVWPGLHQQTPLRRGRPDEVRCQWPAA